MDRPYTDRNAEFLELRPQLFRLAYRITGRRGDAEDTVQEAFLRWAKAAETEIRSPKSFLSTVVARLSLDTLKRADRRRETYVGPWLPEPLLEAPPAAEIAESVSLAFVHLLQSLSPAERAAFLLREVFDAPYAELAEVLETTEANCRQLIARAAKHIRDGRPRFTVDRDRHRGMLRSFLEACASGDPARLMALLREDVVLYSDGGGKARAAINPVRGADRVARFFVGITKKREADGATVRLAEINGEPGVVFTWSGRVGGVLALQLDDSARVAAVFFVVNPEKLP